MTRGIHTRLLARTIMLTLQIKRWMQIDGTRVYSSTQANPVNIKMVKEHCHKIGRDKRIQLSNVWRPYKYVLSTIDTEENLRTTNKEAIQSSILSQCGNTLRTRERKVPSQGIILRRHRNDRSPNAPTYEDLHQQWTCDEQARVAAWKLHHIIYKLRGTYLEKRRRSLKNKDCYRNYLPDRNQQ